MATPEQIRARYLELTAGIPSAQASVPSRPTPEQIRARYQELIQKQSSETTSPEEYVPPTFFGGLKQDLAPVGRFARGIVKPLADTAVQFPRMFAAGVSGIGESLGVEGAKEARERFSKPVNIPLLGEVRGLSAVPSDVEQFGTKTAGQTAGQALEIASLLPAGRIAKGLTAAKSLPRIALTEAGIGARIGALGGAGVALEEKDASLSDVAGGAVGGALIGAALGAGLPLVGRGISKVTKPFTVTGKAEKIVSSNLKGLSELENSNAPLRKLVESSKEKGIDVKKFVSETDLLHGSVDKDGVLRTLTPGGAVEQLQTFIKPQEDIVSRVLREEGKRISLDSLKKRLENAVYSSGVEGGALKRALSSVDDDIAGYALKADAQGTVPLSLVQDAKIDKYRNINYLNPEASRMDKVIAKTLKKTVEDLTESADVKALNNELSRYFSVLKFLERLDGKRVKGGRLGKYFAQTLGGIALSKFGPIGTIAGAEIGGAVQGRLLASKFGGKLGKELEQSALMKGTIKATEKARTVREALDLAEKMRKESENIALKRRAIRKSIIPPTKLLPEGKTKLPKLEVIELPQSGVLKGQQKLRQSLLPRKKR